ncbi:MAG TPA: hypothetical protein VGC76_19560 [Pyrinomonadaceae bacterium]|jgi:hypothetical protein
MFLDAVSKIKDTSVIETNGSGLLKTVEVFDKWKDWHPSQISHHGELCCEMAREWVMATDFSELNGGNVFTGPRWLRQKFNWGASSFPIFWCEAVRKNTLDCGALAALAHEVFTTRVVKSFRVQLIQRFSEVATSQWSCSWSENGDSQLRWIDNDLIYHEGCAILVRDREIKVWDASAGWWIDSKPGDGYGALLAIRVSSHDARTNAGFNWGSHHIMPNQWQKIQ